MVGRFLPPVAVAALLSGSFATRADAQWRPDLLAGPAIVSLPHSNTGLALTLRPYRVSRRGFVLTPQATVISTPSRVFNHATLTITEVLLAADLWQGGLRPTIGGGAGYVWSGSGSGVSFHAMEGFRLELGRMELLFEVRQRTLPRQATAFEIAAGLSVDLTRIR